MLTHNAHPLTRRYGSDPITPTTVEEPSKIDDNNRTPNTPADLEPVEIVTGSYTYEHQDISIPTRGLQDLSLTRSYNNRSIYNGPFGYGWDHNYNFRLTMVTKIIQEDPPISEDSAIINRGNGTVYIGICGSNLCALDPRGNLKWRYQTGVSTLSQPVIGANGMVYIHNGKNLYAVDPNGNLRWRYETEFEVWKMAPAIGTDGTIYIGGTVEEMWFCLWYSSSCTYKYQEKVYALRSDGTLKWGFIIKEYYETPRYPLQLDWTYASQLIPPVQSAWIESRFYPAFAIGSDGMVYVGDNEGYVYAINHDGTLMWSYKTADTIVSSPAISSDGTLYITSTDGSIYAFEEGKICYFDGDDDGYGDPNLSI